jgi:hypothetical protein
MEISSEMWSISYRKEISLYMLFLSDHVELSACFCVFLLVVCARACVKHVAVDRLLCVV